MKIEFIGSMEDDIELVIIRFNNGRCINISERYTKCSGKDPDNDILLNNKEVFGED